MKQSIGRILVETAVRKTIRDIRRDPRRSIRNLVDMAQEFSQGRFQQRFFEEAGQLLHNENSAYYALVQDMAARIDTDRLVTFGMNIGYNGCTLGAALIRSLEAVELFNIPWCISLQLEEKRFLSSYDAYERLIAQGQKLGIYTWQLHLDTLKQETLELASCFPDCAFLLFCPAESLTPQLLLQAETVFNIMLVPHYNDDRRQAKGIDEAKGSSGDIPTSCRSACEQLQRKGIPYGIHLTYDDESLSCLTGKDFLEKLMQLKPVLTFFAPGRPISEEVREVCYRTIRDLRKKQEYPTVFIDLLQDNHQIDSIISSESCSAGFTTDGQLYSLNGITTTSEANFFHTPLKEILKRAFPKAENREPGQAR